MHRAIIGRAVVVRTIVPVPKRYGQTDGQKDGRTDITALCVASRGKKLHIRCEVIRLLPVHAVSQKGRHRTICHILAKLTDFKSSLLTHSLGNLQ